MSEEEKEAIELLQNIKISSWTTKYIMSKDSKNAEILLNLIEKLQKELEQEKEKNINLLDLLNKSGLNTISLVNDVNENYISKDKIRAKIEFCKECIKECHPASDCMLIELYDNYIEGYEKLLEE